MPRLLVLWHVLSPSTTCKTVRWLEWKRTLVPVRQGQVGGEASLAPPCRWKAPLHPAPAPRCVDTLGSHVYSSLHVHTSCLCLRRAATVQIFIKLSRLSQEIFLNKHGFYEV